MKQENTDILNTLFKCNECSFNKANGCKYGCKEESNKVCEHFTPIDIEIFKAKVKCYIDLYAEKHIENAELSYMKKGCSHFVMGATQDKETLYSFHVKYINNILSNIRKGETDYVYNIENLAIINSFEPKMEIEAYEDGCFYINKKI